jgi:CubicO group peptidase (beta-lactamase class C family)
MRSAPLLLSACLAATVHAAPDEDALGRASGYPFEHLHPGFSLFTESLKIGAFSHMDEIFPRRIVRAPPQASPLPRGAALPAGFTYPWEGRQLTVDDLLARQRITGLLVLKDGAIVLERYQYQRGGQHRLASFSMAKTVLGLLVGIAQEEGRIDSLDDAAERYAPELRGSAWGPVTVRNLLRMSSGAKWDESVAPGLQSDGARLALESFFQRGSGGARAVNWVKDAVAPQGTRFQYSSGESFALGVVLRGAIGRPLADYLSERLWQPLGAEAEASWLIDRSGMEAGNCCLNATLRDYGRLGMLLANDGQWQGRQLVSREYLLDATDAARQPAHLKPRTATPFFGYGYQTWIYPYRTRTFQARGLFGQELIVQPEAKLVVVITSALQAANTPSAVFVERNYFVGSLLQAFGGRADVYR